MTQLTARLEELKKLCESAAPKYELKRENFIRFYRPNPYTAKIVEAEGLTLNPIDAKFIAQSRELVPRLIEALELAIKEFNEQVVAYACDDSEAALKEIEAILCEQGGEEKGDG